MLKNHWMKKITASVLCFALAGQLSILPAYATEINESETEQTEVTETVATEFEAEIETEQTETVIEMGGLEQTEQTETETEIESETVEEKHRITGFRSLASDVKIREYSHEVKPAEAEVAADLPASLEVYLDDEDEVFELPVTWKGIGDYDKTEFYYYEFRPVWDESVYVIDTDEELPYIGVYMYSFQSYSVSGYDSETIIYDYLVHEMGLNMAAATGVLANIRAESDFNPNETGDYVNGVHTSYGICQWHNERYEALKNYTDTWETLEGQLEYLNYELANDYPSVLAYLKSVGNSAEGAYNAAYYWCYNFERPADTANTSESRGRMARDTYWPYYSNGTIVISDYTIPGTMKTGSPFSVKGLLSSETNITSVTAGVYDVSGAIVIGKTVEPNSTNYNLSAMDSELAFGKLPAGVYRYKVMAKNKVGTSTPMDKIFVVLADKQTVPDGSYYIVSMTDNSYMLTIKNNANTAGANVQLGEWEGTNYPKFEFKYQEGGYYKIKNVGSGKYLGVANQSSQSGANVELQTEGTLWQVLSDDTGAWYIIPRSAEGTCLDLRSNVATKGQNIDIYTANMTTAQRWKLTEIKNEPVILGSTIPDTMVEGGSFSIRGVITAGTTIKTVTVGTYDVSNNLRVGKTVTVNAKDYDLKNLDTAVKFGSLPAGIYRYKVIVETEKGKNTLVDKVFVVLSEKETVANGVYHISSVSNPDYVLSVKSDSDAAGANIHLWKKMQSDYMNFMFEHQGKGYYKIRNVGSGKYLSVAGQSSVSGANVEQQSNVTLWQVLPDNTGSYYIVPKCATVNSLDLSGNKVEKGRNIDVYTANMTKAQRWVLTEGSAKPLQTQPEISGASMPGTITEGKSFDIRGVISSEEVLTSVTVGAYNVKDKMVVGKTVVPNSVSYDLRGVDTLIKFGNLPAGIYHYKVIAETTSGAITLVNKVFVVLSKDRTVNNGTYNIKSMTDSNYVLSVKSDSDAAGANIHLWKKVQSPYMNFIFEYQSDGYYKIRNAGSGRYLGVAGQASVSGANVEQQTSGTLWQVLPDDTGAYYLVPKCATEDCLDLSGNKVVKGRNIDIYTANMSMAQRWVLTAAAVSSKPQISAVSVPGTMLQGQSFDVRGVVTSESDITSVTVGAYDVKGNMTVGKTVEPHTRSYDLKNIDTSIKFGNLPAGVYRYKVTAVNSAGTTTLVNKVFVVLTEKQTIADGTWQIASMTNPDYVLSIKSDSNVSGANVHLWKKASTSYMKFRFVYQGRGYYKIMDIGSGKYLGVTNQSSMSGTNVEQQTDGTLWQVLPDGTGAYYLIPKCATVCCLDLSGNKATSGRNIDIYTSNMTTAQRWKLQ